MKTIGRILIILVVTALIGGAMYAIVNASGFSANMPFRGGPDGERFRQNGQVPQGQGFQPGGDFPNRNQFRPEGGREGRGGGGLLFGMLRNTLIVAVIVALIAVPKSIMRANRRAAATNSNGQHA